MKAPVIPINGKQQKPAAPKKPKTDWQAVERDYRTGQFTNRELGAKHHADHGLISRKAKAGGWTKDLSIAIQQATNAKLVEELVTKEVINSHHKVTNTIQAAAEANKNVILAHRTGLNRLTTIKAKLLDQIEQAAVNMVDLAEVIEMVRSPDENGVDRANDALKKAMSRSALVDDLKKLSDVDEKVRKGEREAFSIDAAKGQADATTTRMTDSERAIRLLAVIHNAKKADELQRKAA
jgi:hypothetical protein